MSEIKETNGIITIEMPYGDNEDIQFTLLDGSSLPIDMTGDTIKLGLKKGKEIVCEIDGIVSANEVIFPIYANTYIPANIEVGTYKFDFWNETDKETYIKVGTFKFADVAHEVE